MHGIAGYLALGAKLILRTHQKLLSCEEKNRRKSAEKSKNKTFAMAYWDTFIQLIFVNKVVTVCWVTRRKVLNHLK